MTFCYMCRYHKAKIHFCSAVKKYVNIADRNLVLVEGNTHSSVEGYEELRFGKFRTKTFETRQEMKQWMLNKVTFWRVWDPLTRKKN